MHFSSLTSDELSTVLENLSAKQLFSLSNTSRELRVAARQALNAPRFAERKRWASLGERLLKECQHNGHRIVTEAPELVAFEEKYWRRSEHPVSGIWVPYDFTEKQARAEEASSASVSAVGSGYLRAVAPSRCVVRMTGPLEEDCRHVVPRWLVHVLPMWPAGAEAELEAGMHAMQDWHPRAFAFVLLRQAVMRYFARYANTEIGRTVSDAHSLRGSTCADVMATHGVTDAQVRSVVDALVNEGHLYSTIDDEHFKATFP